MEPFKIKQFLQQSTTVQKSSGLPEDYQMPDISIDTRSLRKGDAYIALRGDRFDGHDFIPDAIQKGASTVVYDQAQFVDKLSGDVVALQVSDTLQFLMEFSGWYRSQFQSTVFALTGSTGKTTTKEMLAAILSLEKVTLKTPKNQNNFIGVPLTLFEFQKMTEVAVIELGTNHPGEISALTQIVQPTHAAITNIGSGHIGFFGSKKAIYKEKTALFDGLRKDSTIYLNVEDPYLSSYVNSTLKIQTYGLRNSSIYRASDMGMDERGHIRFNINDGPGIQLSIPGKHQLMNGVLAASVALDLGISMSNVKKGLEAVEAQEKRMELSNWEGITLVNDAYNSNPESLKAAIDFVCDLPLRAGNKKIVVLGDMLELGEKSEIEHRIIGEYLQNKNINVVFCYGLFSNLILEGLDNNHPSSMIKGIFDTHENLARTLKDLLQEGDILLLKGSRGMQMEKILDYLERKG
jgi:UDP-N-acetylmuramoyl-tripeptide--D-alanyl-D-alanine ligase